MTQFGKTADRRIRSLRPARPRVDPWQPHGIRLEAERRPDGSVERALTVFLAGSECRFTCSFCDLWRWTIEGPTPPGALPAQLDRALRSLPPDPPPPDRLKLYNASNFFDPRAVPPGDWNAISTLAAGRRVTVESHAATVGPRALEFARLLRSRLEVAIGLETIHPAGMAHLNKRMELSRFDRAAEFLGRHAIELRVFVLVGAPGVPLEESVEWSVRAVEYAASRDAAVVALIPVRGGNGELERLQAFGQFTPPTLDDLESALDRCLGRWPSVVTADLWDAERLPGGCAQCRPGRIARLERLNITGRSEPPVPCAGCGSG